MYSLVESRLISILENKKTKKVKEKRCEAEYFVDPDAAIICLESSNENMHFEVSFIKRFAFFPLNEEDIPKLMCHKHYFNIDKL